MDNPLVSIIIPCFNSEEYVGEAIRSALNQTHENIEVIVIDDGSTDGGLEVIKSFGDRIRWETGPNRGAPAARNRGVELARGEFIQFLDADDQLAPEKVQTCLDAFTDDLHIVFTGLEETETGDRQQVDERKISLPVRAAKRLTGLFRKKNMENPWDPENPMPYLVNPGMQTARPLHRARFFRRHGMFDPDLSAGQEYEMHLRLALSGARMKKIDLTLVKVRRHGGERISGRPDVAVRRLEAIEKACTLAREKGALDRPLKKAFATEFVRRGRYVYRTGRIEEGLKAFRAARELDRFHRSGEGLFYDILSWILGLERTERIYIRLHEILK